MACLLITALVYFNFIDTDKKNTSHVHDSTEENVGNDIGNLIPNYTLYNYNTKENYSFRSFKGTFTFINFWGTWCGPCVKEMPEFASLLKEYSDINVIAIHSSPAFTGDDDIDAFKEEVDTFINTHSDGDGVIWKDYGITFLQDDDDSIYKKLGGTSIYPMTYVLDENSIIRRVHNGSISLQALLSDYESYSI